jgi:acetyltransferase-like isoleucine patch superfamily enzyme
MNPLLKWLRTIRYKIKFGKKLKLSKGTLLPSNIELIIDETSTIVIEEGVVIRDLVELRATRGSLLHISKNCKIDRFVRIIATNGHDILIGDNARIGIGSVLNGGESITVGKNCLISGYVYLQTSMHNHKLKKNIIDSGYIYSPILIDDGCWLGAHSVIFPGVHLANRCVVGSNAVVNKNFCANSVVGGIPAKELKNET